MTAPTGQLKVLEEGSNVVARQLLGSCLIRELPDGSRLVGKIVETEAYDQTDAASHSYRGRTPRTDVMFGPAGRLYVYFTYGMHYCCNVVTGPEGQGSAVLIRAIEPIEGIAHMQQNRGGSAAAHGMNLTNGPAKLCQAYAINKELNGHDLQTSPLWLELPATPVTESDIIQTTRIGISQAKDVPWRFYLKGNPYVSKI